MNELDTFTINFVTEGIDKLLDGMDKLSEKMDKINTGFERAGSKGDSLFGKFVGWGTKIAGLIGGIYGISKAISDTINSSNEILSLHKTADEVGHTAKEIEVLGLTLQRFSPNLSLTSAYGQAGSFYKALNDLRLDEARLSPSSGLMEELNRAGTSAILATDSDQEIVRKLRRGVKNYLNSQSPEMASASIERLLGAAGISYKDFGGLFKASDADFNLIMSEMSNRAWRYNPKYQQEAQNLAEARLSLSETWKKMTDEMMPTVTKFIQDFEKLLIMMKPIIELVVNALDWIVSKFGWLLEWSQKAGEKAGSWFFEHVLKPYNETKRVSESQLALSRLTEAFDPKSPFLGNDYTKAGQIAGDIALVEEQLGKALKDDKKTRDLIEIARTRMRDMVGASGLVGTGDLKTIKVESTTNQTFNGYPENKVGEQAKEGAEKGTRQGVTQLRVDI